MLGRLAELAVCEKALAAAGEDGAAAVVISGAPGIGRTTLWRAVVGSREPGVMVLRTTGVPGWQPSWANLADLLDPAAETVEDAGRVRDDQPVTDLVSRAGNGDK